MANKGEIVIYQTQDGTTQLDVRLDGETVWITQEQMTQLFQRDKSTISRHIKNIFEDGELDDPWWLQNLQHPRNMVDEKAIFRKLRRCSITWTLSFLLAIV